MVPLHSKFSLHIFFKEKLCNRIDCLINRKVLCRKWALHFYDTWTTAAAGNISIRWGPNKWVQGWNTESNCSYHDIRVWEPMPHLFTCQVLVLTSPTEETTITLVLDNSNATPHWYLPALSKGYYLVLHSCFLRIVLPGFTLPVILPTSHSLDCTPSGNYNFTHRSSYTLHAIFYPNPSMLMNTW